MSIERIIESVVPEQSAGLRLDVYLARRFSYLSRTSWKREIESGKVFLNGCPAGNVKKKVLPGDRVEYTAGEVSEPEIDSGYSVIYEDENYIAINKTGNLPVHPSGIFFHNTLVMLLERDLGRKFYPVHRLDRETSGAILLGKSNEAASAVQTNFASVRKEYRAIVNGAIAEEYFQVDVPIGAARDSLIRKKREAYYGAPEDALTRFRTLSSNGNLSLVAAFPVTGRTHQIRVHLKYAGHTILGDKIYGHDERLYLQYVGEGLTGDLVEKAGFHRCALHSFRLEFFHPYKKMPVLLEAEIPCDMSSVIENRGLKIEKEWDAILS